VRWLRQTFSGAVLIALSAAATAAGASVESDTGALLLGLVLVALALAVGFSLTDAPLPVAMIAMLVFLFGGVVVRMVLPLRDEVVHCRPSEAPSHPEALGFSFVGSPRLEWSLSRTMTTRGGRYNRSTKHRVVPVVEADWLRASPVVVWALDPAKDAVVDGALRLPFASRAVAQEAVGEEGGVLVELTPDPFALDQQRRARVSWVILGALGLWFGGQLVGALQRLWHQR
jgi:hypothetical protein